MDNKIKTVLDRSDSTNPIIKFKLDVTPEELQTYREFTGQSLSNGKKSLLREKYVTAIAECEDLDTLKGLILFGMREQLL